MSLQRSTRFLSWSRHFLLRCVCALKIASTTLEGFVHFVHWILFNAFFRLSPTRCDASRVIQCALPLRYVQQCCLSTVVVQGSNWR